MRKFLFALLLATIICIETDALSSIIDELEHEEEQDVKLSSENVDFIDGIEHLKKMGYWSLVLSAAKTEGILSGVAICIKYLKDYLLCRKIGQYIQIFYK